MNEIRDIHGPFKAWLDKNRIPFHRNRPDKKTTAIKGDPDFLCTLANRCLYIECKVPGKKLSEDQEKRIAYLRQAGNAVRIVFSCEEAIQAVSEHFGVVNAAGGQPERRAVPSDPERTKSDEAVGASSQNLFVGRFGASDYVFEGDSRPGGSATIIRVATPSDLINLRR